MQLRFLAFVLPSAFALSACVAAAIPVLAGGAIARSHTRDHGKERARVTQPASSSRAPVAAVPAPEPSPVVIPEPLPSDAAQIKPGQLYAGSLPPPGPPQAPAPMAPKVSPPPSPAASWSDVGHFVSASLSRERSVLLARGSAMTDQQWLACAGKPPAILAAASTVLARDKAGELAADASSWLKALRVFSVGTVLVAADPSEAAVAKAAFAKAELPALVEGDTLMLPSSAAQYPATRAAVGSRYCVMAVVGRSAVDFPNALTPAATPAPLRALWGHGWFLLADTRK